MATIAVPTTRIRLGYHLCGTGASPSPFHMQQNRIYRWPTVFENQYVPEPTSAERQLVSSFGQSAFFDFAGGTNFAGGIMVRMSQNYTYGEVKIPDSQFHMGYGSPAYNASVGWGYWDIYWDYDTNYSSGFQIMVNSGTAGGAYRGISDSPSATPSISTMKINGHGPDGTSGTTYFDDGGSVTNLLIEIPWADINAVDNIYVYFSDDPGGTPVGSTTAAPPPTTTTTTTIASITWQAYGGVTSEPSCTGTFGYRSRSLVKNSGGSNNTPEVGDTLYTNTLQTTLAAANTWWIDSSGIKAKIGSTAGVVSQVVSC